LHRIGGLLVVGGSGFVIVTGLIYVATGSFAAGTRSLGGTVLAAALASLAIGLVAIAIGSPPLLRGRAMRIGLALCGIGLASASVAAILAGASTYESILTIMLLFLGGWTSFIGATVLELSLLRAPGRSRTIGLLFLGGIGLCAASAGIAYAIHPPALGGIATVVAAIGGTAIVAAGIAVGLLAMDGGPSASVTDA
jgi:hypothetical protein